MNFDWSTELAAARDAVRAVVTKRIDPAAGAIDRDGAIPPDLRAALADAGLDDVWAGGPLAGVCLLEEVATASAAVAVSCGVARAAVGSASLPGLRGAAVPEGQPAARDRLAVAAVAVGLGRAALEEALTVLRASGDRPGGGVEERPHWVLADAATELDAARLLVHQAAAEAVDEARAALAQVFAAGAAMRAVDAAVRVIGAAAYRAGSTLERLARDARATQLLLGTEDQGRAIAAAGLLPG